MIKSLLFTYSVLPRHVSAQQDAIFRGILQILKQSENSYLVDYSRRQVPWVKPVKNLQEMFVVVLTDQVGQLNYLE
jgi:capsid protein